MPWCHRSHVLRHFTQTLSTNIGTMMSQITHFTTTLLRTCQEKNFKKSLVPWCRGWKILSHFMMKKSHTISHKKLGTMMPRMTHLQYHDEVNDPASRDFLRCVAIVWFVWIAGFLVGTAANIDGVCLLPMTHFLQDNWPTSFYQIVPGFWLKRIPQSQFMAPRQPRHTWKNVS